MHFFQQIKNKINNRFVKNVLTLFSGAALSQGIMFLIILVLTRLFSDEAFGILALYSSVILISQTIITLRYELAVVLPKRAKDAINLFAFNLLIISILSVFLFFIILLFHSYIISTLKIQKIGYLIYFVPLSVFFTGSISSFNYWNNRVNLFKNISYGVISKSASMGTAQLLTGVSLYNYIGMVPGMIFGQFTSFVVVFKLTYKSLIKLKKFISFKRMFYLALRYRAIPLFNTVLSFTNVLSNELPVMLITKYFGLSTAGIYGLAIKVTKIIPGVTGQSISQVFYNEATKVYNNNGNLYELIKNTYKNLLKIAFFIFIPLFILSFFLNIIFGENWSDVGIYVRILIPWVFVGFLSAPVSSLIVILKKQKIILIYDSILLLLRVAAFYIGFSFYNSIIISLYLFSLVGVIFNVLILLYFFRIAKQSLNIKKNIYE